MLSSPEKTVEIWGGVECTINRVGNEYFDQLDYSGHYERVADIQLFADLGFKKVRYPVLWEHHQPDESNLINWKATDSRLSDLRERRIDIIAGLVHHGSGPIFVDIMEDSFAQGLAQYAAQVAERYPWIEYYTPVNEPLTTARFCGLYGLWYPHRKDDEAFCRILFNECRATTMAMAAIREFNPNAKLVQTEDLAKIHSTPVLRYQADFENERRWLSYDLLCGKVDDCHPLWPYLTEHGITSNELNELAAAPCPPYILGANHYLTSERYLDERIENYPPHTHGGNGRHRYADVEVVRVGDVLPNGLQFLLEEAWQRYQIPIAVTEVHLHCTRDEQMRWLNDVWLAANRLPGNGIPIVAITPWALLGSFGWDRLLTGSKGTYEAGVFDISCGAPRPTILSQMIRAYCHDQDFIHPVLKGPGWWVRSCRASFGIDQFFMPETTPGDQFLITGKHAEFLTQICRKRCLHVPAFIKADDYMEICRTGFPDLVVRLVYGDLYYNLNAGLDLFLDGETGLWEMSPSGSLIKNPAALSPETCQENNCYP